MAQGKNSYSNLSQIIRYEAKPARQQSSFFRGDVLSAAGTDCDELARASDERTVPGFIFSSGAYHKVLNLVQQTQFHLLDAETERRGYLLTGCNVYLTIRRPMDSPGGIPAMPVRSFHFAWSFQGGGGENNRGNQGIQPAGRRTAAGLTRRRLDKSSGLRSK